VDAHTPSLYALCREIKEIGVTVFQRLRILRKERQQSRIRTPFNKPGEQGDRCRLEPHTIAKSRDQLGYLARPQQESIEFDITTQHHVVCG